MAQKKNVVVDQEKDGIQPAASPAPRKRFRLEKLEERIAPGGHYNPHSKWVGGGNGGGGGGSSISGGYSYSYSPY